MALISIDINEDALISAITQFSKQDDVFELIRRLDEEQQDLEFTKELRDMFINVCEEYEEE